MKRSGVQLRSLSVMPLFLFKLLWVMPTLHLHMALSTFCVASKLGRALDYYEKTNKA